MKCVFSVSMSMTWSLVSYFNWILCRKRESLLFPTFAIKLIAKHVIVLKIYLFQQWRSRHSIFFLWILFVATISTVFQASFFSVFRNIRRLFIFFVLMQNIFFLVLQSLDISIFWIPVWISFNGFFCSPFSYTLSMLLFLSYFFS